MGLENKHFETGSNPYYLNTDNTVKDFTSIEATNPQYSFLEILSKFGLVVENTVTIPLQIEDDFVKVDEAT